MVILKSQTRVKLTRPQLKTHVRGVQNTQDHFKGPHWTRVLSGDQSHAFLTPDRHRKLQTRTPDKTVQQSDTHAKYAAFHRAQLHTHASEPPKNMGWLHRANEKEHWTCQMHALR